MESIKDYFDQSYEHACDMYNIQEYGILYDCLDSYAVRNLEIAMRILRKIELGRVNVFAQERIFGWLDQWYLVATRNTKSDFSVKFFAAMKSIADKTDGRFKRRGYRTKIDKVYMSELYGFGGNSSCISHGIMEMRYIANKAAYKHLAYKYGNTRPSNEVDFPAKVRFFITNPTDLEYAEDYAGNYWGGAEVVRIDINKWEFVFQNYYLNSTHEHQWSRDLWLKIFIAIYPYAKDLFKADFYYKIENEFSD